jgi:protein-tyrosine phosphatase
LQAFHVIDLHSHILPGIDDGARDLEQSVAIVRSMADDGVTVVAATPHVRDDWPDVTPDAVEAGVARVREAVAAAGVEIEVLPGGEVAIDALPRLTRDDLERLALGGTPGLLLLETPYYGWPLSFADLVGRLGADGFTVVIAHPERNADVQERPDLLEPLVRAGGVVQLTAASVDGRLGRRPAASSAVLLERGLAHLIASDAHAPEVRGAGMSAAAAAVGPDLGWWLTVGVPRALLAGERLPQRPYVPSRRRSRGLRGWLQG